MSWAEIISFHLVDAVSGKVVGTREHVDDSTLNLLFEVTTDAGDESLILSLIHISSCCARRCSIL